MAQLIQLAFPKKGRGSYLYPKPCLADRHCGPLFFFILYYLFYFRKKRRNYQ